MIVAPLLAVLKAEPMTWEVYEHESTGTNPKFKEDFKKICLNYARTQIVNDFTVPTLANLSGSRRRVILCQHGDHAPTGQDQYQHGEMQ